MRLRRSSEKRRYAASQRLGRIDANPHQIDAVMFALRRIPEGGCILADEVGLGKTIEAGLVIAQLLAEGASRILIIVPRPLIGQWQDELYSLFGIVAHEAADPEFDVSGPGVFLVGREYAGSFKGSERLQASPPFDLCLIDEAHEIFAGIYKRFNSHGIYDESSGDAQTHRTIGPMFQSREGLGREEGTATLDATARATGGSAGRGGVGRSYMTGSGCSPNTGSSICRKRSRFERAA